MPAPVLTSAERRELRGLAHHLDPVVIVGQHGLTANVLHEIDNALTAHTLIKVRVFSDEREARTRMYAEICEKLECAGVQQLGKLLVIFRNGPASETNDFVRTKKEIERPRHTDFPKKPPRVRKPPGAPAADTRPPARKARREDGRGDEWGTREQPQSRRRMRDDSADRSRSYAPTTANPKTRASAGYAPKPKETAPEPRRRVPIAGEFLQEKARKRRQLEREAAAPATSFDITQSTTKKPADERRRWKDRDNWAPVERTPRPSTHKTPALSKRGAARNPRAPETRRRLRES
jgi:RNA-binding protein